MVPQPFHGLGSPTIAHLANKISSRKNREHYLQLAMFRPTLRQCDAGPVVVGGTSWTTIGLLCVGLSRSRILKMALPSLYPTSEALIIVLSQVV